ncbi:MAG: hypothetical protein ABR577_00390 [Pyrinomonadaceae bacterium]
MNLPKRLNQLRTANALKHAPAILSRRLFWCVLTFSVLAPLAPAQRRNDKAGSAKQSAAASSTIIAPALTRTTTRHESRRLGYGSSITIVGAPAGSITIEAWPRGEVDVTADIEVRADTEADLARLAAVNSFLFDEDANHIRIVTTGTHDKAFMRRAGKDFPKRLLGLPWKIDYHIRVPAVTDLEIDMGRGAVSLTGVEGSIRLNALESDATLALSGGQIAATVGRGSVNVKFLSRSWRGRGVDIRLASGNMSVEFPANFSADVDAEVLRTGQIENTYATLLPRERTTPSPRSIRARAGAGGPTLAFTVGDGALRLTAATKEE